MWNPHCGWCSDHQHLASFMTSAPPQAPLPLWPNCSSKTSSPGECRIRTAWCTKLRMDLMIPTAGLLKSKNGSAWGKGGGGGGLKTSSKSPTPESTCTCTWTSIGNPTLEFCSHIPSSAVTILAFRSAAKGQMEEQALSWSESMVF